MTVRFKLWGGSGGTEVPRDQSAVDLRDSRTRQSRPAAAVAGEPTEESPTSVQRDAPDAGPPSALDEHRADGRDDRRGTRLPTLLPRLLLVGESQRGMSVGGIVVWAWAWALLVCSLTVLALALPATTRIQAGSSDATGEVFLNLWRVFHLLAVPSDAGPITLLPLLGAMVVMGVLARAAGWVWMGLRGYGPGLALAGVLGLAVGYGSVAALVLGSPTADRSPGAGSAGGPVPLMILVAAAALLGLLSGWHRAGEHSASRSARLLGALTRSTRAAVLALLGSGALVVAVWTITSWSEVTVVAGDLLATGGDDHSAIDTVSLLVLQIGYLPNLVVWALAYLVGPGFVVGQGATVSPFEVSLGTVPDLPLLAALPDEPVGLPLLLPAIAALSGLAAGAVLGRAAAPVRLRHRMSGALMLAAAVGCVVALLALAAGGSLGEGRLADAGPDPIRTGLAAGLAVGVGALVWALLPSLRSDLGSHVAQLRDRIRRR